MQVVRRTWDWLAEQPEDAAELALLLFEAAPKLNFGDAGPSRAASAKMPRRASVKAQGGFRRRLAIAVPMAPGGILPAPPLSRLGFWHRKASWAGLRTGAEWDAVLPEPWLRAALPRRLQRGRLEEAESCCGIRDAGV